MSRKEGAKSELRREVGELRRQAERLGGEIETGFDRGADASEVERDFLRSVIDFECAPRESLFQQLVQRSIDLPAPAELSARQLERKVRQVKRALRKLGVLLQGVREVSDQRLYTDLWHDLLRDEYEALPPASGQWFIDRVPVPEAPGEFCYVKYLLSPVGKGDSQSFQVTFKV